MSAGQDSKLEVASPSKACRMCLACMKILLDGCLSKVHRAQQLPAQLSMAHTTTAEVFHQQYARPSAMTLAPPHTPRTSMGRSRQSGIAEGCDAGAACNAQKRRLQATQADAWLVLADPHDVQPAGAQPAEVQHGSSPDDVRCLISVFSFSVSRARVRSE